MYKEAFPQYSFGKSQRGWLHSKLLIFPSSNPHSDRDSDLEEVAKLIGLPLVTQVMLKACPPESRGKAFGDAPMRHNAAGDVLVTLIALIELLRYKGLDFSCLGDWNLMAFDL
jgi:hypothetical protein